MYINEIRIENYGAIKKLLVKPELTSEGYPKPLVIVGKNGSGKTLLITQLVDSIIEMKRKKYDKIAEVSENNYYKLGKKNYISYGENYSFVHVTYEDNSDKYFYTELMTNNFEMLKQQHQVGYFNNVNLTDEKLIENGYFKNIEGEQTNNFFEENIVLYFPVYRYYTPSWYNQENGEVGFIHKEKSKILGRSDKSLVKDNVLKEIENWILELLLDKYLYEETRQHVSILDGENQSRSGIEIISTNGKNTNLHRLLNELLTTIYKVKFDNIEYARLGIAEKGNRRISILIKRYNEIEMEIAPTFSHLSSGEAMIIALFGTLLKEYDGLINAPVNDLSSVKGIVIIDEIDLNLHIEFAKEILPKLMLKFPNVPFVFTTHSPFLLLGMEEVYGDRWQMVNMPQGNSISVNDFSEIKQAYTIFTEGYEELEQAYKEVNEKIENATKTLIITEGKTDWKHLKNAYTKLKDEGEFSELDIDFYHYEDEVKMSDSELYSLLKEFSKVPHIRKVIGIFDRDEGNGKLLSKENYKIFNNNIFGFSIPNPEYRSQHQGISIEFLYKDTDIKRIDENGRRIYLSSEFNEVTGRFKEDLDINITNVNKIKGKTDENTSKIIDTEVFNKDGRSLALTKNDFAKKVYEEHPSFLKMDLDGFKPVFEILKLIESL